MAVTKLMCLKETKKGNPSQHLINCLNYILNPQKNENGLWVGGNCGTQAVECYWNMIHTKKAFAYQRSDKMAGRQGYHFMVALPPGEGDMETLMKITKEFCEKYLRDNYEYVISGHTDKAHKHTHIVFNSVSRSTGKKYHYNNGDWAKEIQPIVNRLCEKYGLSTIDIGAADLQDTEIQEYGESESGLKKRNHSRKDAVKMDIDRAIAQSGSYDMFLAVMREQGYKIRQGASKRWGEYASFSLLEDINRRTVRSYQLGKGYSPEEIHSRIESAKEQLPGGKGQQPDAQEAASGKIIDTYYRISGRMKGYSIHGSRDLKACCMTKYQLAYAKRIIRARRAYQSGNPKAYQVQNDFRNLQKLSEELMYMRRYGLSSEREVRRHLEGLKEFSSHLKAEQKKLCKKYGTYRKGPEGLFFLYEKEMLPSELIEPVSEAYSAFQEEKGRLSAVFKNVYVQEKMCERILERMEKEQEEFQWKFIREESRSHGKETESKGDYSERKNPKNERSICK